MSLRICVANSISLPFLCAFAILSSAEFTTRLSAESAENLRQIAIVHVSVIPMDRERVIPDQTVIIKAGRILLIGPSKLVVPPHKSTKIDGRHLFLMPGLADMHAHLSWNHEVSVRFLTLFVASGVTTILNMRGQPDHLQLRREVADGKIIGPAIYTTGPFLGDPVGGPLSTTPAEIDARVAADKAARYDFIKLHGDLSRAAYEELLADREHYGIRVVGHLPRNLGIDIALDGHQDAIAHAEEYLYAYFYFHRPDGDNDPPMPDLEQKTVEIAQKTAAAHVTVIPNLVMFKEIAIQEDDVTPLLHRREVRYMPKQVLEEWLPENNTYVQRFKGRNYAHNRYPILEHLTKALQDAGVRLLVGTDTAAPCLVPGFSVRLELEYLVEAGLTPYQALRAATANAGEFLGVASGKVEVGQRADLLALRANPLVDIRNVAKLDAVILNGRWLSQTQLRKMLNSPPTLKLQ
jgi:imidazolonepropionase-like amidohydrolase